MENSDYLRPEEQVKTTIYGPEGERIYEKEETGFRSIEAAIRNAIENAVLKTDPENCVYEVTNETTGVSHRYRINAHGNLKLIV